MEDLNWKYVAYSSAIALLVVVAYHYVLKDYMPGAKKEETPVS